MSRKEQKEKTHDALVDYAERLFAEKGIGATTTADIAKALKLSHGAVFVHFATREELIHAVVEKFGDRLSSEMGRRFTADMTLRELLRAHLLVLSEFEDFYMRLISESHGLPPAIRSIVYSINASLSYRFYRAAQLLMKEGKIKKLEQPDFFNTWMALLHYQIMNRDLLATRTPILREHGDQILRHFFNLIKS